ncbi:galactose ABC transporter substrate-binding protein [Mariniplasma anaerobium]|uniref:D-galactose/methyl-galactoside binding periplasmic protein MglB n=1 Tax=Mariniplasma anaerobium TaxID=2735436 RepID=A0A7U9TIF7_9MOLU|nr:galactose ABC transporter substrate-binding protein [Mariniplasma anaerobium]BCR36694.1 galactose ABC transporter substrate-binding protein [Mariniplasma anaerobium]
MKKIIIFVLVSVSLFVMSGCQSVNNTIPLILYDETDPYILEFKNYILEDAIGNVDIKAYDSQNSQLIQNEIIESLLDDQPQLLIINPVDRLGAYTIIDEAQKRDIPLIFINREPIKKDMNSWDQLYYLGAPAENSAIIQSEMVIELFGNPYNLSDQDKNGDGVIQLVIFKGEQGHQDAEIRTEVIVDELERYGYELEILSIEICDWQRDKAYDGMNKLLLDLEVEIELVISNNDAMALGAIDAMVENELFIDIDENDRIDHDIDTWIPVIGIDGIADATPYLESGYLYGTVINDSQTMSLILIELTQAILNNTDLTTLSFEIEDGKYIWVDYKRYEEED